MKHRILAINPGSTSTKIAVYDDGNLLFKQSIDNCNIQSHLIENPVGGSDSTAFARAGFKTVTINAQDPRPTDYYHTTKDGLDNLRIDTLEKGYEVVKELIRLIDEKYVDKKEN